MTFAGRAATDDYGMLKSAEPPCATAAPRCRDFILPDDFLKHGGMGSYVEPGISADSTCEALAAGAEKAEVESAFRRSGAPPAWCIIWELPCDGRALNSAVRRRMFTYLRSTGGKRPRSQHRSCWNPRSGR